MAILKKQILERIRRNAFYKKNKAREAIPYIALLPLMGCGTDEAINEPIVETENTETLDSSGSINYFDLISQEVNQGSIINKDIISATSDSFKNGTSLIDENPYDEDELTVDATVDIVDTPSVSGIEMITFTTSASSLGSDNEFDVNLLNISGSDLIYFENTNSSSPVVDLNIANVSSAVSIGSHFQNAQLSAQDNTGLEVIIASDLTLSTTGNAKELTVNANGNSLALNSSTAADDITVNNADNVDINYLSSGKDLTVVANGNFSALNIAQLQGNIIVRSGGTIDITTASSATGTLALSNERAPIGSDIVIKNANSVGYVSINSVGSITATDNDGFKAARTILATAGEDSAITADGVADQSITLTAKNSDGETTHFTLNASSAEQLAIAGTSPIVVVMDGADISTESVSNTNSDATLWLAGADTDLTQVAVSLKLRLKNHDGNTLTIKDNQDFYLDAEFDQTANTAIPVFDHITDATSQTTNAISLKAFDSDTSNVDTTVAIAGLTFTDIQTLNVQFFETIPRR